MLYAYVRGGTYCTVPSKCVGCTRTFVHVQASREEAARVSLALCCCFKLPPVRVQYALYWYNTAVERMEELRFVIEWRSVRYRLDVSRARVR